MQIGVCRAQSKFELYCYRRQIMDVFPLMHHTYSFDAFEQIQA